jgi:hypothetical protein
MITLGETELCRACMQFARGVETRVVEGRVAPASGRFRSPHGQASIVQRHVFPLERFDLTRAQAAKEIKDRRDVRKEPCRIRFRDFEKPRLIVIGEGLARRWLGILQWLVILGEAVPQFGVFQNLSQDGQLAVDRFRRSSESWRY